MGFKIGNFTSNIHDTNYKAKFEQQTVDNSTLIQINGRERESLNGKYTFTVDPYETCLRSEWFLGLTEKPDSHMEIPINYNFELYPTHNVPSCWNMEDDQLYYYSDTGLYFRNFKYKNRGEEHVFLHLEGAMYRCYVFMNHEFVGVHDGGSTPFSMDVTEYLKEGENEILFSVDTSRESYRLPMDNTDWFNYGGLYRDIYLLRTPKVFIKDYYATLVPNQKFDTIHAEVTMNESVNETVVFEIAELGVKESIEVKDGKGEISISAKPELWSPDSPKLYDVTFTSASDSVSDKIGFREIRVEGLNIILNGKEIFLKGISIHEDHVDLGKTTNDDIIRQSINQLKDMYGNFFRLAHYPHTRRFAQIADEMGVLLWEEVPVYWAIDFKNPATIKDGQNQLRELILRDRNRASVIIWSVGNENPDTDERLEFMIKLVDICHELDPTRPTSAACLVNKVTLRLEDRLMDHLDIIGNNEYYGWYDPNIDELLDILDNTNLTKPVIIAEFGAGAKAGYHSTKESLWSEEFQAELYRRQYETMAKSPFIKGTTPWIFYDFRAVRRLNKHQEGFNRKGLIAEDRKTKKLAYYVTQDHYKNM